MNAERATKLTKGCVVVMAGRSGMPGYGNAQCVQEVCEPLGTVSLYGHNEYYNIRDINKIVEYPILPNPGDEANGEGA